MSLPVANFKIRKTMVKTPLGPCDQLSGRNWLVLVDAYSKYPCIHPTTSTSSNSTTAILEQEFAHFGYPHTLVTDNACLKSSKLGANNEALYISPEHLIIQQQTVLPSV